MENETPYAGDEGRPSRRGRLMGRLFGAKDKKALDGGTHTSQAALDAFLHSSADKLSVTHAPPPPPSLSMPKLAKLDTTISRYPQALAVNHQAQSNRPTAPGKYEPPSRSPKKAPRPNRKGLVVRFADSYPDVIGEGGDESELPVMEISKNRKPRPRPPPQHRSPAAPPAKPPPAPKAAPDLDDLFVPKSLRRTQTGFSSIYEPANDAEPSPAPARQPQARANMLIPGASASARYLGTSDRRDDNRRSYIEVHQAQMREAEGKALAQAARTASAASQHNWEETGQPPALPITASPEPMMRQQSSTPEARARRGPAPLEYSPAASIASNPSSEYLPPNQPQASVLSPPNQLQSSAFSPPSQPQSSAFSPPSQPQSSVFSPPSQPQSSVFSPPSQPQSSVFSPPNQPHTSIFSPPSGPSAFYEGAPSQAAPLAARMASVRLQGAVGEDEALAAFAARTRHLFELFRLHAETARPLSSCPPRDCARASLWWFLRGRMGLEVAIRDRPTSPQSQMQNELDRQQAYTNLAKGYWLCDEAIPEIVEAQRLHPDAEVEGAILGLMSALKKLSQSMKRNGILPPEEPFLPQTIDKSIWIEYPPLSQDMVALLSGNWGPGLTAMQSPVSTLQPLDAFPLGDTPDNFNYGRVVADVFLKEQGRETHRVHFPCILSVIRPQKQKGLVLVIASQNGCVQLAVQGNKNAGPVWDDVRWRSDSFAMDIRLPRGFMLTVQLAAADYKTVSSMYDFSAKVQATMNPRSEELLVFRNNLRSFQYMEAEPASRAFPKEPVPRCEVALFERIYRESSPAGPRNWHCGFRIAVTTGPRTRTVNGVHHTFPPSLPVQFGFFRAEGDAPALSVKYESGRQRGRMVLVFNDDKERVKFHSLLTGTALNHDEKIFADVPIKSFMISQSIREPLGVSPFSRMPWKAARVVNDEFATSGADQPPTVLSDKLKVVLEYQNGTVTDRVNVVPGELRMRLEVSNSKVLRILRQAQQDMTMSLSEAQVSKELPRNLSDALQLLGANQTIRTYEFGSLKDLHDFQAALTGYEVMFDALAATCGITRRRMVVPIHKRWEAGCTRIQVVKLEERQLQLLAFFEDFQHGHCMNFVLKGTDVYESFHRGGRPGIRFVDAKFPLPRLQADKNGDYDDVAFVCLDLPDLPGEHDDIAIMFDNEADRDGLIECLPAPVKGSSRTSRLK